MTISYVETAPASKRSREKYSMSKRMIESDSLEVKSEHHFTNKRTGGCKIPANYDDSVDIMSSLLLFLFVLQRCVSMYMYSRYEEILFVAKIITVMLISLICAIAIYEIVRATVAVFLKRLPIRFADSTTNEPNDDKLTAPLISTHGYTLLV